MAFEAFVFAFIVFMADSFIAFMPDVFIAFMPDAFVALRLLAAAVRLEVHALPDVVALAVRLEGNGLMALRLVAVAVRL